MRGFAVLHPMGWDAFGLPAENEALHRGRHPRETTAEYARTYRRQLRLLGCSYDWGREFSTSDPAFYQGTQWGFLLLFRRGLVYRASGRQWWCPKCRTILANEQVEEGRCWRHPDTPAERRVLEQWYVRTTAYADRLAEDLDQVDWPEPIKAMQRNWIGRSVGADVRFRIEGREPPVTVFTSRPETIRAAVFLALAPEHPLVRDLAPPSHAAAVAAYVDGALRRSEIDRAAGRDGPSGVFTGAWGIHPLSGERLPVFVADYVLGHYGTGAIMGVPAGDERDAQFAARFGLNAVSLPPDPPSQADVMRALLSHGAASRAVRYRMRDWLVSRQRYWGAPIPLVHCPRCGTVPVPEGELPIALPDVAQYAPSGTGRSPLAGIPSFVQTSCQNCGGPAERETDTLDGFADSNWYFLRFADPVDAAPWSREAVQYWLPVDWYIGGAEHAVMHLLYARFFTKVLYDEGLVPFSEPFIRLRNQGSLLSPADGTRMSKSRGNVVTPDEVVASSGADALRLGIMFLGPFDQDVTWTPAVVTGSARFVQRMYRLVARHVAAVQTDGGPGGLPAEVAARLGAMVAFAGEAIEQFRFNVLVAGLMSFLHDLERWEEPLRGSAGWRDVLRTAVRILAPIAPFLAEETWAMLGGAGSVHHAPWPESAVGPPASHDLVTVVVQVDGKVRDRLQIVRGAAREEVVGKARATARVQAALSGRLLREVVVVPDRVVNFVTASRP
jgi:leucyl-tRNA synthetase